jgi:hypothetical protein
VAQFEQQRTASDNEASGAASERGKGEKRRERKKNQARPQIRRVVCSQIVRTYLRGLPLRYIRTGSWERWRGLVITRRIAG